MHSRFAKIYAYGLEQGKKRPTNSHSRRFEVLAEKSWGWSRLQVVDPRASRDTSASVRLDLARLEVTFFAGRNSGQRDFY